MNHCPGCDFVVGRFRAVADGDDAHVCAITCRRTGASYTMAQGIPQHPAAAGSKVNKRRKSRRPIVIAERRAQRRAAAASKAKQRHTRAAT